MAATMGAAASLAGRTFIFYYLWYGNPQHNGRWQHWDHEVLPHWTEAENRRHPNIGDRHEPPAQLHSPFRYASYLHLTTSTFRSARSATRDSPR